MDNDATKRSVISVFVAAIVVIIVYFLVPSVVYSPKGILLPRGKNLSAILADQVSILQGASAPKTYQSLGYVNVQYHSTTETRQGYRELIQYARSLAGQAGANAIILIGYGHTAAKQVPASQASYILRGMAIYYMPSV